MNNKVEKQERSAGEIVLYQPDETIKIEVTLDVENDTVWLNTMQISQLFNREESNIRRHIGNIFREGELDRGNNVHFLHVIGVKKPVPYYDLDVIISVGYRVHSTQGVLFRRWVTSVLKDYLLRGCAVNRQMVALQQHVDDRLLKIEDRLDRQQADIDFYIKTNQQPSEMIFPTGCVFDAWEYVAGLVREAKNRIILIDKYCDERTLILLAKRQPDVPCIIYTRFNEAFDADLQKHNRQYSAIRKVQLPQKEHDRFLMIDGAVYILGDSLKDLGHSMTTVLKTAFTVDEVLEKMRG